MTIKIVNMRSYDGPGFAIDRKTPVGNPYHIGAPHPQYDHYPPLSRSQVIELYRAHLTAALSRKDRKICSYMNMLYKNWLDNGELVLKCWCAPDDCHGRIIKETLENARALREWRTR